MFKKSGNTFLHHPIIFMQFDYSPESVYITIYSRTRLELYRFIVYSVRHSMVPINSWLLNMILIHSVFCLTTGQSLHRFLHIMRSRASSFKWEYPVLSLRSSNSFLRLIPRLLVTSISPFILPSITCFRRQFLRKMWPIQVAFHFLISCRKTEG